MEDMNVGGGRGGHEGDVGKKEGSPSCGPIGQDDPV